MGARWSTDLDRERRRWLVGRSDEIQRFQAFLRHERRRLMHIHGPAGVGKTFLVAELMRQAEEQRLSWTLLDGHWIEASPAAIRAALSETGETPALIFIDTFEKLAVLEGWLRAVLFPELASEVRVVTSGRNPLSDPWLLDPGWHELVEDLVLRNLSTDDSRAYLERRGVSGAARDEIAEACHGHPLSLAVSADLGQAGVTPPPSSSGADRRLRAVLHRIAEEIPDDVHRRALLLGAMARTVTEPLLRDALQIDQPRPVADWLRERPFVQVTPDGLLLHDLVRESFFAELRTRDPDLYELLLDRAIHHYLGRLSARHTGDRVRVYSDSLFLLRHEPAGRMLYLGDIGELYLDEGGIDPGAIVDVVRRHEGPQAADAAEHWLERLPDGWVVTRDAEQRMTGLACFVDLDDVDDEDAARDPVAAAFRDELARRESMRPGERARLCRFWMCVQHHQTACATQTLLFSRMSVELGLLPRLAVGAAVHIPAGEWKARADMTHELMCRLEVDEVDVGVFGHDWRKESPVRSFGRLLQVLRGVPGTPKAPPEEPEMVFLDRSEFARAARRALKDFHNPVRLEDNPLTAAPLVVRHGVEPSSPDAVGALRQTLRETCHSIRREEDEVFASVLEQTYLRPTPKQLAVADELGLSFRTYRRRLSVAVDLAITRLWERETSGAEP